MDITTIIGWFVEPFMCYIFARCFLCRKNAKFKVVYQDSKIAICNVGIGKAFCVTIESEDNDFLGYIESVEPGDYFILHSISDSLRIDYYDTDILKSHKNKKLKLKKTK